MCRMYRVMLLALVILTSFFIISWTFGPGPGVSENSFLIEGDGFNNQRIILGITSNDFENNYYAKGSYNYNQDYQNMTIRISGANNTTAAASITGIDIDFNSFTKPGIYSTDSAISVSIFFKKDIPTSEYERHYTLDSDGMVHVKTYDPVGGLIEGTFSGTFVKMKYNKETNLFEDTDTTVKVTNGKFSVIHNPDYHWDAPQSTGVEPEDFKEKKKKGKKI
jgi:hypothetical protein